MTRLFCRDHPETLRLDATVLQTRPGAVLLSHHPFYPGGGGQLLDRGCVRWRSGEAAVVGFAEEGGRVWLGGTHLDSTGASRPVRILKIDNKGRSNRRVRIGLQGV